MIRQFLLAGLSAAVALVSLLAGSGIGKAYHLYPLTALAVMAAFVLFPLGRTLRDGQAPKREFFLTLGLALVIGVWPAYSGYGSMGLEYGWLLLLPYVVGQFAFSERDTRTIGFSCGVMGFVIVAARVFFGVFGNWNNNDIAMAGFMGCVVCSAVPWRSWGMKIFHKILLIAMTAMLLQLNSRSCLISMVVLTLFAFRIIPIDFFIRKKWARRIVLIFPLLVAVAVVLFQNSQLFVDLNDLSMEYIGKTIFNGRNVLWEKGLKIVWEYPLLGKGRIDNGQWHNCAITAMTAFGMVGYALWLYYFDKIMCDAQRWKGDLCLAACMSAFLTVMFQQSFELGLISTTASMMPYLIMGIMLGRMRYLSKKER